MCQDTNQFKMSIPVLKIRRILIPSPNLFQKPVDGYKKFVVSLQVIEEYVAK